METKSLISLIFLFQATINGVYMAILPNQQITRCGKNGNLNSTKLLNSRDLALNDLTEQFSFTYAQKANRGAIWAMVYCPTKINMEDCRQCVRETIPVLKKNCPKEKEGAAWAVLPKLYCMVRYADQPNRGNIAEWAHFVSPPSKPPAPANVGELEKLLNNLTSTLKEVVNRSDTIGCYASGSVRYSPGSANTLYGSMQCAPSICGLREDCAKCLSDATNQLLSCCSRSRKSSGWAFSVNCAVKYSHYNFLP